MLNPEEVNSVEDEGDEILVSQCESAVTMELPEELSDEQAIAAEAYTALYALGGYTYNNVVHKAPDKQCNLANNGEAETDNDLEDEKGIDETDKDVNEEALIRQKSPYEQKLIREHRQLFRVSRSIAIPEMSPNEN